MGAEVLAIPLTRIINFSVEEGVFPEIWKVGVVTPVLKKGSPLEKSNYRPVSCLSVLSKVLEKIVCDQITDYMEKYKLLPQNQHRFRAGRSTMSALSAVQQTMLCGPSPVSAHNECTSTVSNRSLHCSHL